MSQDGFQLIAIRPLVGCAQKFLKLLNPGEYYFFYQYYQISKYSRDQEKIQIVGSIPPAIFDINRSGDQNSIKVNISAVVGKNGTGKSSIVELLYVALYNVAHRLGLHNKTDEDHVPYTFEERIFVAFYYRIDEYYYKVELKGPSVTLTQFNPSGEGYADSVPFESKHHLFTLFYSIVINYSQYALNTQEMGHWLKAIFHKNDGYQTPIVLNPFRREGIVDINIENHLVKSRLLANIIDGTANGLWFSNMQKLPKVLLFELDKSKFEPVNAAQKRILQDFDQLSTTFFEELSLVFFGHKNLIAKKRPLDEKAKLYILFKLESITRKYRHYRKCKDFLNPLKKQLLEDYLERLKDDNSHITFKLKQAIHFLLFNVVPNTAESFQIDVEVLSKRITNVQDKKEYKNLPTIELIPPSFFTIDIQFEDKHDRFGKLSSGEKQKIYALSSLIYHLKNLNSVLLDIFDDPKKIQLVKYSNINIIFDEVELYYHPDLQRRFIKDLLDSIRAANLGSIRSINMIFITHSPFILSDIPAAHILYLKTIGRRPQQLAFQNQTFGGNIHDLLSNSFFLDKDGYIGEYAKGVINSAIKFMKPEIQDQVPGNVKTVDMEWTRELVRELIDIIGEPLIKRSLNSLYSDVYLDSVTEIDKEIARLEQLKIAKA